MNLLYRAGVLNRDDAFALAQLTEVQKKAFLERDEADQKKAKENSAETAVFYCDIDDVLAQKRFAFEQYVKIKLQERFTTDGNIQSWLASPASSGRAN